MRPVPIPPDVAEANGGRTVTLGEPGCTPAEYIVTDSELYPGRNVYSALVELAPADRARAAAGARLWLVLDGDEVPWTLVFEDAPQATDERFLGGETAVIVDTAAMALSITIGFDGAADIRSNIPKPQAAEMLRQIADQWGAPPALVDGPRQMPVRCPSCSSDDPSKTRRCSTPIGFDGCVMPSGHFDIDDPRTGPHLSAREAEGYDRECHDGWHQAAAYLAGAPEVDGG